MSGFSHVDQQGNAHMVDVAGKESTTRVATAAGCIVMQPETLKAIRDNSLAKGDVLSVARVAGIMAAKKTPELIPLCHPIMLSRVSVDFSFDESLPGIRVATEARCIGQTGVEMEALSAATVALLTVYDMAKAIDRGMLITDVMLVTKSGGQSGAWERA